MNRVESIADHSYRMSLICLIPPSSLPPNLDLSRSMKLCLVHDIAESLVGDITPSDRVARAEKQRREEESVAYLSSRLLGEGEGGEELQELWREFEANETVEAKFANDVDKIEMLLQMRDYEMAGKGEVNLGEFGYAATKVQLPAMKTLAEEILREREAFWMALGRQEEVQSKKDTSDVEAYYSSVDRAT